jgi:hypothetical protein
MVSRRSSNERTKASKCLHLAKTSFRRSKQRRLRHSYTSLQVNEIRLLRLQPGRKGDRIVCTLHVVNLLAYDDIGADAAIEGFERYEAISYVWGNAHHTAEIECTYHTRQHNET